MNGLAGFREQYPQYNDMSDQDLATSLHAKFYSDIPQDTYFKKLGIGTSAGDQAAIQPASSGAPPQEGLDPYTGEGAKPVEQPDDHAPFFGPGGSLESYPERTKLSVTQLINGMPNLMKAAKAQIRSGSRDMAMVPVPPEVRASDAANEAAVAQAPEYKATQDRAAAIQADMQAATPKNESFAGEVGGAIVQSAPPMLAGIATGALLGPAAGVAVGVGGGSLQQAQQSFDETGELTYSLRQGLYEGLGEAVGMKAILAPAKSLVSHIVRAVIGEFGQEAGTQLAQDIDDRLTHHPEMTLGDIIQDKDLWHSALVAGTSGVLMGGAAAPISHLAQKSQENAFNNQMEQIAREDMERTLARKISPDDVAWRLLQVPQKPTPIQPGAFGTATPMDPGISEPDIGSPMAPTATMPTPLPGVFTTQPGVDPEFVSNPYVKYDELGQQLISAGIQPITPVYGAESTGDRVKTDFLSIYTETSPTKQAVQAQNVAHAYINNGSDITLSYLADQFLQSMAVANTQQEATAAVKEFHQGLAAYGNDLNARKQGNAFGLSQTTTIPVLAGVSGQIMHASDSTKINQQWTGKETLAPGEVIAVGQQLNPAMAKAVVEVVTKWLKTFNHDSGVVIVPHDNPRSYGAAWIDPQGNMMIELNASKLMYKDGTLSRKLPETLVHELGHALGAQLFRKSHPDIQKAVIKAWNADNLASLGGSWTDLLRSRRGPAWMEANKGVMSEVGLQQIIAHEYTNSSQGNVRDYYMNFDEWMAHNFERIFAGNVYNWQSPVRRYMQDAYRRFKALFKTYTQEYAPNETFKQFLDYHIARNQVELQAQRTFAIELGLAQSATSPTPSIDPTEAQQLVLGTDPEATGNQIGEFLKWGDRDDERSHARDVQDHIDWSKTKRVSYTLLQVAKLNPQLKALYDPFGVRDPQTGEVVKGYIDYVLAWNAERMQWMSRADEWLHGARSLSRKEQGAMAQYAYAQLREGKFFDGNDPVVRQNYHLTDAVVQQYNKMTQMFQGFITAMEDTLRAEAMKRIAKNPFASGELAAIKKRFDALRAQPYAPMMRYGEFITKVLATGDIEVDGVKYHSGDTIYREHFDTKRQRKNAQSQIQAMFPTGLLVRDVLPEDIKSMAGMPGALLDAMKDKLGLTDEQRTKLQQYIYEIAPSQSFVKRLMQRRGILGYSFDLQRSFANYFFHGANHIARVKYHDLLMDARMRLHADTNAKMQLGGDVSNQREIENYVKRHFDDIMNPKADWAAARGVVALAYLGGIIKTAVMNLSQVPLATYPHLAQKYGDIAAIAAIRKAYSDQFKAYRVLKPMGAEQQAAMNKWVQGGALTSSEEAYIKAWTGMDAAKRDDLLRAQRENTIDQSQAMELAAMSEGQWLSRFKATDELGYYARSFGQAIMIPFQLAEKLNRRVTFMAAHDLATKDGLTGEARYQAAKDAVDTTQLNYEKWNRPEMLRGKKGLFMMFMQFNLGMLHLGTNGFSGNVAKWNWRWWALMLASGGTLGLPFAENLIDLAEWALLKMYPNQRINIKHELKKLVGELAGNMQSAPDIFLHGLSRYGFGLVPFADLSGSISMGRMIPGTDVLLAQAEGASWNDALAKAVTESGGATSSLVLRMMQGLASNDPDSWKRWEKALPMTAMQNISASLRWYQRGAEETSKGGDLVKFDASDPWQAAEMVGKSLGFTPERLAAKREDVYIKQDISRYYETRKGMLLNAVDEARQHGDTEAITRAIDAVRDFNSQVPIRALGITGDQLRKSLISKDKARTLQSEDEGTNKTEQIVTHAINSGAL